MHQAFIGGIHPLRHARVGLDADQLCRQRGRSQLDVQPGVTVSLEIQFEANQGRFPEEPHQAFGLA